MAFERAGHTLCACATSLVAARQCAFPDFQPGGVDCGRAALAVLPATRSLGCPQIACTNHGTAVSNVITGVPSIFIFSPQQYVRPLVAAPTDSFLLGGRCPHSL